MKYFYPLLLAVFCIPLAANAQFSEDFENVTLNQGIGDVPSGWTTYDQDGNTPSPNAPLPDAWNVITFDGVNKVAISTSLYTPAGQADDWMVTPQITVPSTLPFLIFEEWNTDPSAPGEYEVLISTTGNTVADFTTVIHSENNPSSTGLEPVAVDLSTYSGQQVYIAFRNITNQGYLLAIDNVEVLSLPADNLSITSLELPAYSALNTNNTLKINVKNLGSTVINTVDIEWSDGTNTYPYNITNLNLQPYATTTISHNTPVIYSNVVEKNISVTASNVNGNTDPDLSDNSMSTPFHTVSQTPTKYVVIEEGTGTWCQFCPRGIVAMEYMYANPSLFPNFIGIAVHSGHPQYPDPMQVNEYAANIGLTGLPGCNVDRVILNEGVSKDSWVNLYNSRKDVVSPVDVGISASYDESTREVTASVTADFYTNYSQADLRFAIVVVEDGVTGTSQGYAQINAYAGGSLGPMGGFENLPNPVPASQMVYDRVGIALLGGYDGQAGSIASTISDGDSANYTFTYTLPNDVDDWQTQLVALVIDQSTGQILNAKETASDLGIVENPTAVANMQVYPNPASEFVNISFGMEMADDVNVNIYSMSGRLVKTQNLQDIGGKQSVRVDISSLATGEYLLSLSTNEGAVTKKIIVK